MLKKRHFALLSLICAGSYFSTSCAIIRQGEVGVKSTLGRVSSTPLAEGPRGYNPFVSRVIRLSLRTENLEVSLPLPSKEGLTIQAEISILYSIQAALAPEIIQKIGMNYEQAVILPVFRSSAADVTARFFAKDMHSGERSVIEREIRDRMDSLLVGKGFVIENVLMKSIRLPAGLSKSIEEKLQAEQDAQRMEFIKEREQRDAERRFIQAKGERDAQIIAAEAQKRVAELRAEGQAATIVIEAEAKGKANIIQAEAQAKAVIVEAEAQAKANDELNKSLSPSVLRLRSIEAFEKVSTSNNTKTIITNDKTPFLGMPVNP